MLEQFCSVGDRVVGRGKDDIAVLVREASGEEFGEEGADLFGWEVDDANNLLPHQLLFRVVLGNLHARLLDAELAEVGGNLVGGLTRLGEILYGEYRPDPQLYLLKIWP